MEWSEGNRPRGVFSEDEIVWWFLFRSFFVDWLVDKGRKNFSASFKKKSNKHQGISDLK